MACRRRGLGGRLPGAFGLLLVGLAFSLFGQLRLALAAGLRIGLRLGGLGLLLRLCLARGGFRGGLAGGLGFCPLAGFFLFGLFGGGLLGSVSFFFRFGLFCCFGLLRGFGWLGSLRLLLGFRVFSRCVGCRFA